MSECIFCKIVAGKAPAKIVRQFEYGLAFVPLNPVCCGHVLIIPDRHVRDAAEDPEITALTARYAAEYAASLGCEFNIITSAGKFATQSIMHLHLHVVPRREGDGLLLPWSGTVSGTKEE